MLVPAGLGSLGAAAAKNSRVHFLIFFCHLFYVAAAFVPQDGADPGVLGAACAAEDVAQREAGQTLAALGQ